jgi:hypothetical protein
VPATSLPSSSTTMSPNASLAVHLPTLTCARWDNSKEVLAFFFAAGDGYVEAWEQLASNEVLACPLLCLVPSYV